MKCNKCGNKVQKFGKVNEDQRYFCVECNKTFTEKSIKREIERIKKYDKMKRMYLEDGLSTIEIGRILGVSSTVPQRILKKMGITKSISEAKKGKKIGSKLPIKDIIKLYEEEELSTYQISEILNCSRITIRNILRDNNIEIKKDERYKKRYYKSKTGLSYEEYINQLPELKKYRRKVINVTNKQPVSLLLNYNKRGVSGIKGAYQLDHKFSIIEGFKNKIDYKIIGNINNLEFIPWEENISKGINCSITLEQLIKDITVRVK